MTNTDNTDKLQRLQTILCNIYTRMGGDAAHTEIYNTDNKLADWGIMVREASAQEAARLQTMGKIITRETGITCQLPQTMEEIATYGMRFHSRPGEADSHNTTFFVRTSAENFHRFTEANLQKLEALAKDAALLWELPKETAPQTYDDDRFRRFQNVLLEMYIRMGGDRKCVEVCKPRFTGSEGIWVRPPVNSGLRAPAPQEIARLRALQQIVTRETGIEFEECSDNRVRVNGAGFATLRPAHENYERVNGANLKTLEALATGRALLKVKAGDHEFDPPSR